MRSTFKTFSRISFVFAFFLFLAAPSRANFEGIPEKFLIYGKSRPCCSFAPVWITKVLGLFRFSDPTSLGDHDFGRLIEEEKIARPAGHVGETTGQLFTCRGGFLDISHLRDNADWSATIYRDLQQNLGKGISLPVKCDGGCKRASLELPALSPEQLAKLSPKDISNIAIALTFDLALFHEIATSFAMAVSVKRIPIITENIMNEKQSAFSVEDAYSNLLGAYLGIEAAESPLPFNSAMTSLLEEAAVRYDAQNLKTSEAVMKSLSGKWWKGGLLRNYKSVKKRTFDYVDLLSPKIPDTHAAKAVCGDSEALSLEIPSIEGITGLDHTQVAYLRVVPNAQYNRKLKHLGVALNSDGSLTRDQFEVAIDKIRKKFTKRIPGVDTFP